MMFSTVSTVICLLFTSFLCDTAQGSDCLKGWTAFGFSCYTIIHQPLNWFEGMNACKAVGGSMVEIDSMEENRFLTSLMLKEHDTGAWIGLADFLVEGDFVWTSSQEPMEFVSWDVGQPSDQGGDNQDCGKLRNNGHWDDDYCSSKHWVLCEKDPDQDVIG